jgi:antitoxin component of MazEF toxin-antitoxin module
MPAPPMTMPPTEETHLEVNREVEITVKGGKLVVEAIEPGFTLNALLDQVTSENRHGEVNTGKRVGKEVW